VTIRPIVRFPDPRLRIAAEPVSAFDEDLSILAGDLLETIRAVSGIGITAPHIGIPQRLVILDLPATEDARIYVNPVLVWASTEITRYPEGSISMPGVQEEIERPTRIRVQYQDLSGVEQTEEADGLLAVCHLHEIDQLDGIFWIQRLSPLKRDRVTRRYEKLRRTRSE
jgi:peptide deformylase